MAIALAIRDDLAALVTERDAAIALRDATIAHILAALALRDAAIARMEATIASLARQLSQPPAGTPAKRPRQTL